MLKLPQIVKLLNSKSAEGLSVQSYEVMCKSYLSAVVVTAAATATAAAVVHTVFAVVAVVVVHVTVCCLFTIYLALLQMETGCYLVDLVYQLSLSLPFSAYGELVFILIQGETMAPRTHALATKQQPL